MLKPTDLFCISARCSISEGCSIRCSAAPSVLRLSSREKHASSQLTDILLQIMCRWTQVLMLLVQYLHHYKEPYSARHVHTFSHYKWRCRPVHEEGHIAVDAVDVQNLKFLQHVSSSAKPISCVAPIWKTLLLSCTQTSHLWPADRLMQLWLSRGEFLAPNILFGIIHSSFPGRNDLCPCPTH